MSLGVSLGGPELARWGESVWPRARCRPRCCYRDAAALAIPTSEVKLPGSTEDRIYDETWAGVNAVLPHVAQLKPQHVLQHTISLLQISTSIKLNVLVPSSLNKNVHLCLYSAQSSSIFSASAFSTFWSVCFLIGSCHKQNHIATL